MNADKRGSEKTMKNGFSLNTRAQTCRSFDLIRVHPRESAAKSPDLDSNQVARVVNRNNANEAIGAQIKPGNSTI
jgi:hypothetical protein